MEKNIEIANIYEIYKKLLTKTMQEIFEMYYFSDLSLREIGENKSISYQAVRDSIKSTEKTLLDLENKLKIYETKGEIKKVVDLLEKEDYLKAKKNLKKLGEK